MIVLPAVFHNHRRVVEFDGGFDAEFFTNHGRDTLQHKRARGGFGFPEVHATRRAAVGREEKLLADEAGNAAKGGGRIFEACPISRALVFAGSGNRVITVVIGM